MSSGLAPLLFGAFIALVLGVQWLLARAARGRATAIGRTPASPRPRAGLPPRALGPSSELPRSDEELAAAARRAAVLVAPPARGPDRATELRRAIVLGEVLGPPRALLLPGPESSS